MNHRYLSLHFNALSFGQALGSPLYWGQPLFPSFCFVPYVPGVPPVPTSVANRLPLPLAVHLPPPPYRPTATSPVADRLPLRRPTVCLRGFCLLPCYFALLACFKPLRSL